jgi:hypothetical protein
MIHLLNKPNRRWIRFSLRSLLLLVVVIAVPLAWRFNRVRSQRLVIAEIEKLDAEFMFDYEYRFPKSQPPGPIWLTRLFGDDFFADVAYVQLLDDRVTDETLRQIARLSNLNSLYMPNSDRVTDQGLAFLGDMTTLETLTVAFPLATDDGLVHLQRLSNLADLNITTSNITDAGLVHLSQMPKLKSISFTNTPRVTEDGLRKLAKALPECRIVGPLY